MNSLLDSQFVVTVHRRQRVPDDVAASAAAAIAALPSHAGPTCHHSPDFASVVWYGQRHTFSASQRAIVSVLWNAYQQGTADVHGRTLLREADSYADDVRDLFRGHPAWDAMIRRSSKCGGPAGCFRLVGPEGGAE